MAEPGGREMSSSSVRVYSRNDRLWVDLRLGPTFRERFPAFGTSQRAAQAFAEKCRQLAELKAMKERPSPDLLAWLEGLPLDVRECLVTHRIVDRKLATASKPISEHLTEYEKSLRAKGRDEKYIRQSVKEVKATQTALKWRMLSDIDPNQFERWMHERIAKGDSHRTVNARLVSCKCLISFLMKTHVLASNPLQSISKLKERGHEKVRRRALSNEDFIRFLKATDTGPRFRGMMGWEWGILFRLAAATGFRWAELFDLCRNSFVFGSAPAIYLSFKATKNDEHALLPLNRGIAPVIERYFREKPAAPEAPAFSMPVSKDGAEIVRFYLARTGDAEKNIAPIPYRDATGRQFDFHALRGMFATGLHRKGVQPAMVMESMRHSSLEMTQKYTHLDLDDMRQAIECIVLPPMDKAVCVDDNPVRPADCAPDCAPKLQKTRILPDNDGHSGGTDGENADSGNALCPNEKPRQHGVDGASVKWLPPRDSNPDLLIQSQLSYH